jgi:hypothetical protein
MLPSVIGGAPRELQRSIAGAAMVCHESYNGASAKLQTPVATAARERH